MKDILVVLEDLHKQAVVDRSHYYTGMVFRLASDEIMALRLAAKAQNTRPDTETDRATCEGCGHLKGRHCLCRLYGKLRYKLLTNSRCRFRRGQKCCASKHNEKSLNYGLSYLIRIGR